MTIGFNSLKVKIKYIKFLKYTVTVQEKAAMVRGNGLFRTVGVERLNISPVKMSDGPIGIRNEFLDDSWMPIGNSDD